MEFRRINSLPPYVFTIIDALKIEARRAGADVIDLGFGNPDLPVARRRRRQAGRGRAQPPQPPLLVQPGHPQAAPGRRRPLPAALRRRARPRHRGHQHHRGQGGLLPPDVDAAPARRRRPGAVAVVPDPHLRPAVRRGRHPRGAPRHRHRLLREPDRGLGVLVAQAAGHRACRSRTTRPPPASTSTSCSGWSTSPASTRSWSSTTTPTPSSASTATCRRRSCRPRGPRRCAVELYSMTKSFSMAGWRVAFLVGNRRGRRRAGQAQELPRLRHLPAHPDRRHRHAQRGARLPEGGQRDLPGPPRRAVRRPQPHRLADRAAQGHDVRVGADPRALPRDGLGRVRLATWSREAQVAVSPGVGFGPGGDGHVRFALIENEQRINQAIRNLRRALTKLGSEPSAGASGGAIRQARRSGAERRAPAPAGLRGRTATAASATSSQGRPCSCTQRAHQLGGDAEDGVGDAPSGSPSRISPRSMPSLTWRTASATAISSPLRMAGAKRSSVAANWRTAGAARGARPTTASTARMPSAMRRTGSSSSLDGLLLGPAQVVLGVAQDLEEQLLLAGEVPVEDALADAQALRRSRPPRSGGSRARRSGGRRSPSAAATLAPALREAAVHGAARYTELDRAVKIVDRALGRGPSSPGSPGVGHRGSRRSVPQRNTAFIRAPYDFGHDHDLRGSGVAARPSRRARRGGQPDRRGRRRRRRHRHPRAGRRPGHRRAGRRAARRRTWSTCCSTEMHQVDGVDVEDITPAADSLRDPRLDALETAAILVGAGTPARGASTSCASTRCAPSVRRGRRWSPSTGPRSWPGRARPRRRAWLVAFVAGQPDARPGSPAATAARPTWSWAPLPGAGHGAGARSRRARRSGPGSGARRRRWRGSSTPGFAS